ncbi:MAG: small multi-drug export protein, partial [Clostridia bacterium]|nr:small multi-drug export protein [Clostridia bacterium]
MINLLLYSGNFLAHFSTFFIAMLPFIEAKGAIPIGMSLGLSPINSFFCSYIGSLVPVPFLLMLIIPLLNYLSTNKKWSNWAKKLNNYIIKKTTKVQSLNEKIIVDKPIKLFALFMFVAI